ncbi:hypothetical protein TPHA_0N00850 [Tetrapisispora phaffii CBS 4417]|uniref:Response regulatory domain-containing protein n=1 Tax=Tetrapisispora phaffii (strain ATCC 24235 / CBS 4417 / NBRC 1672 / NRRL Y-8282 / UCD 70-5) TaxID=1071381 RepID=G8C138_TETPH|nr:hypothetical protein TPHA_0N00850 [Tetrapisispora phaffii CBS 4417]CCE65866.1 hypothetical protein TPHA_0N00850 [Tetrapisispora phaffii CBS 4417]
MQSDIVERRKPLSPLFLDTIPFNSVMGWKIWVKLDDRRNQNIYSQPTAIVFSDSDTIDDLKTKILLKLSSLEWASCNDNTTFSLGVIDFDFKSNIGDTLSPLPKNNLGPKIITAGNGDSSAGYSKFLTPLELKKQNDAGKSENIIQLNDSTCNNRDKFSDVFSSNARLSPSSIIASSSNLNLHNLQHRSNNLSQYMERSFTSPETVEKRLKFTTELIDENLYGIIFSPDEMVRNVYTGLFGPLGSQSVAEPLLIFHNSDIQQLENEGTSKEQSAQVNVDPKKFNEQNYPTAAGENIDNGYLQSLIVEDKLNTDLYNENPYNVDKDGQYEIIPNYDENGNNLTTPTQEQEQLENGYPTRGVLLLPENFQDIEDTEFIKAHTRDKSGTSDSTINKATNDMVQSEQDIISNNIENVYETNENINQQPGDQTLKNRTNSSSNFKDPSFNSLSYSTDKMISPIEFKFNSEKVFPNITVLIVEDNVINQTILASFLRKHKISYRIAKNGREAVEKWKEGGIHLIFMDLQLPVMSGIDAAKEIRECEKLKGIGIRNPMASSSSLSIVESVEKPVLGAPVIMVAFTASNSLTDKREALVSGCNDYLTKPVNLHWLSKKITEWGCMQALIDFDNWKQGQRRMTDRVIVKQTPKLTTRRNSENTVSRSGSIKSTSRTTTS